MKHWSLTLLLFSSIALSQSAPTALVLNSYHPQYPWTASLTEGVVDALLNMVPHENIHVEFLDSRRFSGGPLYEKTLKQLLAYKYKLYKPDVIITSDDYAYNFMLDNRDALFPNTPVVFSGVNSFDEKRFLARQQFTGILEGVEIVGNLELIKRIQPKVNRVVMLGDTAGLGLRLANEARLISESLTDDSIQIDVWDTFSFTELHQKVSQLPASTAIFILAIHKDRLGQYFSYSKDLQALSKVSSVPIYGMWGGVLIGNGALGGMLNDPYEHGQEAGFIALAVLSGTDAGDIDVQPKAQFNPVFDYEMMQRFNINEDLLPLGSQVMNKPVSLYENYKFEINAVLSFMFILILVINVLLINIRKRQKFEVQLDNLNKNLELKIRLRTQEVDNRNQQLELANETMKKLANTDMLTGLSNRRAAQKELDAYIHRSQIDKQPLSVALMDIDHFKRINDQYGHQVGDDVLIDFARVLKDTLRPSDRIYRWGGEEFLIVFPQTNQEFSSAVCSRLLESLAKHSFSSVGSVTASIGLASMGWDESSVHVVQRADECFYEAKDNGRNQVVTHQG